MEKLKEIKFIAVHHTGNPDSLEKIKNLHVNIYKWEDIGYHWLIDKQGNILKGRDEKFIGAHVLGHNRNSLSVCLIGNFDQQKPSQKQIESLITFLKKQLQKQNLSPKNILGHREFPKVTETCPGKCINLDKMRMIVTS